MLIKIHSRRLKAGPSTSQKYGKTGVYRRLINNMLTMWLLLKPFQPQGSCWGNGHVGEGMCLFMFETSPRSHCCLFIYREVKVLYSKVLWQPHSSHSVGDCRLFSKQLAKSMWSCSFCASCSCSYITSYVYYSTCSYCNMSIEYWNSWKCPSAVGRKWYIYIDAVMAQTT